MGADLVIGHACTGEVHVLNEAAALAWERCASTGSPQLDAEVLSEGVRQLVRAHLLADHDVGPTDGPAATPCTDVVDGDDHEPVLAALGYRFTVGGTDDETVARVGRAFPLATGDELDIGTCHRQHRYQLDSSLDVDDAIAKLRAHVHVMAVRHSAPLLPLHAAGVVYRGGLVALIGPGGAGKSTLAAGLTREGFEHAADEIVGVDLATGRALAVPGLVNVKRDGRAELVDPRAIGPRPWPREQRWRPLVLVVAATYDEGAEVSVDRLEPARALVSLVANSFPVGRLPDIDGLVRVAERVPTYDVVHGDHRHAARAIGDLARSLGEP